jgi:hypothetical protein
MSAQRHLRNAALLVGAYGAVGLLWLARDLLAGIAVDGWWLDAALHAGLVAAAYGLLRGWDLAWFAAVLAFAAGLFAGLSAALDWALGGEAPPVRAVPMLLARLLAGGYGLWALLLSPGVRALRAARPDRGRHALPVALALLAAVALALGWYLDRLSPAVLRLLAVQLGIAALFAVLIGVLAARRGGVRVSWAFLPLALAAALIAANLPAAEALRELRPIARELRDTAPDRRPALAARLRAAPDGLAGPILRDLRESRERHVGRAEAALRRIDPIPLLGVLGPDRVGDPEAVAATLRALGERTARAAEEAARIEASAAAEARAVRQALSALPPPLRARAERRQRAAEDAYRAHHAARLAVLARLRDDLGAVLAVLAAERGHYAVDPLGAIVFEDGAAADVFDAHRAALDAAVLEDAALRTEGVRLASRHPPWAWLEDAL